jgi:ribosomal protein S16
MLKIKLVPMGKKHQISYRIGVCESKSKVTGHLVANLGTYLPNTKHLSLDREQLKSWQAKGAQVTSGFRKIIKT